jgi:hypothetical protein
MEYKHVKPIEKTLSEYEEDNSKVYDCLNFSRLSLI